MTKSPPRDVTRVGMSPQPSPKGKSIFTGEVRSDSGAARLGLGSVAAVKAVTSRDTAVWRVTPLLEVSLCVKLR